MFGNHRRVAGITGIVLVGVYSLVMIATSGAADWAWLVLATAALLLVTAARREGAGEGEQQDG